MLAGEVTAEVSTLNMTKMLASLATKYVEIIPLKSRNILKSGRRDY